MNNYCAKTIIVMWDIENCKVSLGCNPTTVRDRIVGSKDT